MISSYIAKSAAPRKGLFEHAHGSYVLPLSAANPSMVERETMGGGKLERLIKAIQIILRVPEGF